MSEGVKCNNTIKKLGADTFQNLESSLHTLSLNYDLHSAQNNYVFRCTHTHTHMVVN